MKDGNTNTSRKGIIILFSVLGAVIIGLIVAIVVVSLQPREGGIEIAQDARMDCLKVQNEFASMDGYPYDEIMKSYEKVLSEHDDDYNLNYSVCYANFLYSSYGDIDSAIDIMSTAENFLNNEMDDNTKMGFYSSFEYYYKEDGDDEMAELYYDLVKSFVQNDTTNDDDTMEEEE